MHQYILKIVVQRDDDISRILRRMASGTVIVYTDKNAAIQIQKEFHDMAATVITGLGGRPENYYGFSVVISEKERCALASTLLDLEGVSI